MPTDPDGHTHARRRVARHRNPVVDDAQVGEARHEPEHEHAIGRAGVQANDVCSASTFANAATSGEIGPELAAVADRDADRRAAAAGDRRGPAGLALDATPSRPSLSVRSGSK